MATGNTNSPATVLHPVHGLLLAGALTLYIAGLLSDIAYAKSYQIQWTNFASWLVAGGNVVGGLALLWSILSLVRSEHRITPFFVFIVLLTVTWALGFFNSLIHAKDAWAIMPTALILSVVVVLFSCLSTGIGFAKFGVGGER